MEIRKRLLTGLQVSCGPFEDQNRRAGGTHVYVQFEMQVLIDHVEQNLLTRYAFTDLQIGENGHKDREAFSGRIDEYLFAFVQEELFVFFGPKIFGERFDFVVQKLNGALLDDLIVVLNLREQAGEKVFR